MGLVKSGGYKEIFVNCIAGKNEPVLGVAENLSFHTWGVGRWRGVWKPSGRLTLSAPGQGGRRSGDCRSEEQRVQRQCCLGTVRV